MIQQGLEGIAAVPFDVCIIGAGPAGIALALACDARGLAVLLIESGRDRAPDADAARFSAGHQIDPARHAAMALCLARGLGGTSQLWGGRCVPFDPVDFDNRPQVPEGSWPFAHGELAPHYEAAADFLGLGRPDFLRASPSWASLAGGVSFDALERWAPLKDMGRRHGARLAAAAGIICVLGATATGLALAPDGRSVGALLLDGGACRLELHGRALAVAAGGLETTRLMLAAQADRPAAFGGPGGALGRYYMGHLTGRIADICLSDPALIATADFFPAGPSYARRRFTLAREVQHAERLLNTVFWVDQPQAARASEHRNGLLSLVWLAMAVPFIGRRLVTETLRRMYVGQPPYQVATHCRNVMRAPFSTLSQAGVLMWGKFAREPRVPGFIARDRQGCYPLQYHAEQSPSRRSRVALATSRDAFGVPFLKVDYVFEPEDFAALLRAHRVLDAALRRSGLARLRFHRDTDAELLALADSQAFDGYHQIGTTRMGASPADSVVDRDCRVHGVGNLYLASSSVFRTSSQANPTVTTVALALRLGAHLADMRRRGMQPG